MKREAIGKTAARAVMAVATLLALCSTGFADMLGRFEVLDARLRNTDAASPAAIVWSLDTMSGALSACNAAGAACASAKPWQAGEIGAERYRIASQYLDGAESAYLWIIDTATGAIRRCHTSLAAEPALSCGE